METPASRDAARLGAVACSGGHESRRGSLLGPPASTLGPMSDRSTTPQSGHGQGRPMPQFERVPASLDSSPGRCNLTHLGQQCHAAAWDDYIRNHIVSTHAKRLINNFLAADCTPEEPEDNLECAAALPRHDVDTSWVDLQTGINQGCPHAD